jgi:hypothetical protein
MRRGAGIDEIRSAMTPRTALLERGWTERALRSALEGGSLHRVRRGWFVEREWWDRLWPESRHLAHVLAVDRDARSVAPVFSHASAAVLWGLPLYRVSPTRTHVLAAEAARHSIPDVLRHEGALPESDVVVRDGIRCTSLRRTVIDCARLLPLEAGVAVADAALAAELGRDADAERWEQWRGDLLSRLSTPRRGVRRGRFVVSFADPRSDSTGESVSRLHLHTIGFRVISLQVPVAGPAGREYRVDFGLDEAHAFGEFDGEGKYTDESLRSGRTIEQVYLAEKEREDWIRGTTGRPVVRWGSRELASPEMLAARLAAFGIRPRGPR